jgi:hypothetical protein
VAGAAAYGARYPGIRFSKVAATNRRFNGPARLQAQLNHVELVDGSDLAALLNANPIRRRELSIH